MRAAMNVILEAYRDRREEIAEALAQRQQRIVAAKPPVGGTVDESILSATRRAIENVFDEEHGGFGNEPKFPQTDLLEFILLEFERTKDASLERILSKTLRGMSYGGTYDHIEGGFFRYSTTRDWSIPHFEKMTEDHAGLLRVYARTWRTLGTHALRETLLSTLSYIRTTLRDPATGLFAGSQDADETYYASTLEERRAMRAPYIDRTSYTNQTAHMAGAFALASGILADDRLLAESLQTLDTINASLLDEQGLCYHFLIPGRTPRLARQLPDQTAYLRALLDTYEASGEMRLLTRAVTLARKIDETFSGDDGTLADHAGDTQGLLAVRATPLPENASFADSFLRLHVITADERYRERAHTALKAFAHRYTSYRTFAAPYASAVARFLHGGAATTIVGAPQASSALREAAHRLPDPLLVTATLPESDPLTAQRGLRAMLGTPVAYICRGKACGAPVTDAADLRTAFDAFLGATANIS
jgi:uncharacterized protein YyaL (SSP411 family)